MCRAFQKDSMCILPKSFWNRWRAGGLRIWSSKGRNWLLGHESVPCRICHKIPTSDTPPLSTVKSIALQEGEGSSAEISHLTTRKSRVSHIIRVFAVKEEIVGENEHFKETSPWVSAYSRYHSWIVLNSQRSVSIWGDVNNIELSVIRKCACNSGLICLVTSVDPDCSEADHSHFIHVWKNKPCGILMWFFTPIRVIYVNIFVPHAAKQIKFVCYINILSNIRKLFPKYRKMSAWMCAKIQSASILSRMHSICTHANKINTVSNVLRNESDSHFSD